MPSCRPRPLGVLLLVSLIAGFGAAGAARAAAGPGEVLLEDGFAIQDLTWSADRDGAALPELPQLRTLAEPGLPALPVRELVLLVPSGRSVKRVWIEPLASHRERRPGALALAEAHVTDAGETSLVRSMEPGAEAFPVAWGVFTGTHFWRGYQLATVSVYPLRDLTGTGDLEFLDRYAVRVEYDDAVATADVARRQRLIPGEDRANADIVRGLVANPEAVVAAPLPAAKTLAEPTSGFEPTQVPSLSGSAVSFLIITNEAMASEFQRLADHKTAQGLPTVVRTREFVAANFRNGADIQETLRMFIRDAYEMWGIEYVMLGGDTDILPPRYVKNTFWPTNGHTMIPVELYFAGLDGNWNDNANALFGEITAEINEGDFAEEIYIGRAPVSSGTAAAVFVDKVIGYESTGSDQGWPNRILYAAEVLFPETYPVDNYISMDGAQFATQMINDLVIPCTDMEYLRMFETDEKYEWDVPLNRSALIDTLNNGRYGIFNQIGHGFYFNMSVGDANFMNADADALTNGDHLFLLYSLNCASAAFDYSCLMERFVQNPNGGSVMSIGSARAAFPNTSNAYQQEFFSHLYCQSENRAGRLVALSRLPFIGGTAINYLDRWTFENYSLIGDPTVRLWTGAPGAVTLAAPSSLGLGPQGVTVTVTDALGGAVVGATVCLSKDGEDYAVDVTDLAGQVVLDFLPVTQGDAVLTVAGRNLERASLVLPVTAGSAYLALDSMTFTDITGNGNAAIEAGESVSLWPTLVESGGGSASGITATLSCADPGVNILVPTVSFGNVGPFGTTASAGSFDVEFDPTLADGTPLTFQITADTGAGSYLSEWLTVVTAPEVEPVGLDWNDATYGNGDGFIGPNERITVSVRVKNFGAGLSDHITARLRSSDANVVIYDSLATYRNVELMEETAADFDFSLALVNSARVSASWILFEDNYGRTFRHDFVVTRPEAPLNIYTDTSLGADVIALSWDISLTAGIRGYHVYRSMNAIGPFARVNEDLIEGTSYFRDEGLDQLTHYYYRVTSVSASLVPSAPSLVISQSTAPAELPGFPAQFRDETSSHLAVGDVDGDGDNEIVLASEDIYVWHDDGTELIDGDDDSQSLGPLTGMQSVFGAAGVVLAHIDDVAGSEIIASENGDAIQIHIFNKDGEELPGWPRPTTGVAGTSWNWATPAVGDIDGDGDPEIVVNTLNGVVWAWHQDGSEVRDGDANPATQGVFYVRAGATWEWSMSGPALYDLDGDGALDIIFGTRSDATGTQRIMAIRYDGTDVAGFPALVGGAVGCHPAVGDLNGDGMVEIVVWTSWQRVYVVQQDGTPYPGFPKSLGLGGTLAFIASPALGNLDDDPDLEILISFAVNGDLSNVVALDTDTVGGTSGTILPGWPVQLPGSSEGSPVIGDINGDGNPDVLHGIGGGSEDAPNNLYAFNRDGTSIDGFPITLGGPLMPSVVICDLDTDWDVDIVYGGWDRQVHVWDMPFSYDRRNVPWPTFQANMERTGVFFPLELVGVDDGDRVPSAAFEVKPPFPNPFNPSTTVRFYVSGGSSGEGEAQLAVFDLKGRRLRVLHSGPIAAGWHEVVWDGRDGAGRAQPSGVYFVQARSGAKATIHKMTLVK